MDMNKKMRELLEMIKGKTEDAKKYLADGETKDVDKATALLDEIEALKKEYEAEEKLFKMSKETIEPAEPVEQPKATAPASSIKAFADAARLGFPKSMSEGTNADGGYTVPQDIQTRIEKYKEAKASLKDLVSVSSVSTLSGRKTFKKRASQTGFSQVSEGGKITAKATPQFDILNWSVKKYAGYFPITNELLDDTDENLTSLLIEWIGDESRVTANKNIVSTIESGWSLTKMTGVDDIKKAINVTLGEAFANSTVIVTNDDGLQYLDTLKDKNDRYLLTPDLANAMTGYLAVGARKIPVKVIPNADLPSDATTETGKNRIPFLIGDFKEAIEFFDRKQITIAVSKEAAIGTINAFENDLTIYRAIEREDIEVRDAAALVRGYIAV